MIRTLIAAAALLALPACATLPGPAVVANASTLDERLGIAATVGYTAASTLGNRLWPRGSAGRPAFQVLDQRGYDAVQAIRVAYFVGNSTNYLAAIERAKAATAGIGGLAK